MNVHLLIDALVAQTTVLIAQLATSAGSRTPLAHIANQVFLDLISELKRQGLGNKVIADMFGLALRTYHDKVQRLTESQTFRGHSLLTAIVEFVQERQTAQRQAIFNRFSRDDERVVKSVLRDLVDSGILFRSGKGAQTMYKVASSADLTFPDDGLERAANLLWVTIHQGGSMTVSQIAAQLHVNAHEIEAPLSLLVESGRAKKETSGEQEARYQVHDCVIELGNEAGWEGAVYDHFQAVVLALTARLREDHSTFPEAWQGGTTYTFDVWSEHPFVDEVAAFLADSRKRGTELRRKVEHYNQMHAAEGRNKLRFVSYVGQSVRDNTEGEHHDSEE